MPNDKKLTEAVYAVSIMFIRCKKIKLMYFFLRLGVS